jgi:hypothetical protein
MPDQRRYVRCQVTSPVEFSAADVDAGLKHVTFGFARDVSLGGAFVQTAYPASEGRAIVLRVWRPGWSEEVQLRGHVRWSRPDGMGVEFAGLGRAEARRLGQLVAENAAPHREHEHAVLASATFRG